MSNYQTDHDYNPILGMFLLPVAAIFSPIISVVAISDGNVRSGLRMLVLSPLLLPLGIISSFILYPSLLLHSIFGSSDSFVEEDIDKEDIERGAGDEKIETDHEQGVEEVFEFSRRHYSPSEISDD